MCIHCSVTYSIYQRKRLIHKARCHPLSTLDDLRKIEQPQVPPLRRFGQDLLRETAAGTQGEEDDPVAQIGDSAGRVLQMAQDVDLTAKAIDLAFTPDGRYLLTASAEPVVRLWDVATGKQSGQFEAPVCKVAGVAIAADGHRAVTGCIEGTAITWDLDTGLELHRISGHAGTGIASMAVSPDGRYLATGAGGVTTSGNVRLWRMDTGELVHNLRGHTNGDCVAFTPDSREVLSVSFDGTLRMWDVDTGAETSRFSGHTAAVNAVAVFPDGRSAATASVDGTIRVWYLDNPARVPAFPGAHEGYLRAGDQRRWPAPALRLGR